MLDRIKNEPLLLTSLIAGIIVVLINFGVEINNGQQDAIINLAVVVVAVLFGRSKVTPVASLPTSKKK